MSTRSQARLFPLPPLPAALDERQRALNVSAANNIVSMLEAQGSTMASPFSDAVVVRAVKDLRGSAFDVLLAHLCADSPHNPARVRNSVRKQLLRLSAAGKVVYDAPPGGMGRFAWRLP